MLEFNPAHALQVLMDHFESYFQKMVDGEKS